MVTIEDLPEIVLVEILSWVPRKELILNCRLVCSCWRDLVDLPFLWKRKCQRMGFYPETSSDTFQDWRTLCFLKCIRNLVKNPCGEEGLYFWYLDWNRWTASPEIMPTERIQLERLYNYKRCIPMPRPPQDIQRCFIFTCQKSCSSELSWISLASLPTSVSPLGICMLGENVGQNLDGYAYMGQHICLREKGYSDRLMDEFRPIIRVKAWHFPTCPSFPCRLVIRLMSDDFEILQECCKENDMFNCWRELSHTFDDYPPGVRIIMVEHEGYTWNYLKITGTSIIIDPEEMVPREPQAPSPLNLPKKPSLFSCISSPLQFLKRQKNTS